MGQEERVVSNQKLALERLNDKISVLEQDWSSKEPFHYIIIDDFLPAAFAEEVLAAYPEPEEAEWDGTTYIHQRKKLT